MPTSLFYCGFYLIFCRLLVLQRIWCLIIPVKFVYIFIFFFFFFLHMTDFLFLLLYVGSTWYRIFVFWLKIIIRKKLFNLYLRICDLLFKWMLLNSKGFLEVCGWKNLKFPISYCLNLIKRLKSWRSFVIVGNISIWEQLSLFWPCYWGAFCISSSRGRWLYGLFFCFWSQTFNHYNHRLRLEVWGCCQRLDQCCQKRFRGSKCSSAYALILFMLLWLIIVVSSLKFMI